MKTPSTLPILNTPGPAPTAAVALTSIPDSPARSLYIHIPFCSHKCHYCDFYSFVDTKDQQAAFVVRLLDELAALALHAAGAPLRTIFIGGGTPSLLRLDLWTTLLDGLARRFDLSAIQSGIGECEFTVECNPESISADLLSLLRAGGVNRISMGAQSFQPAHLATLQRLHNPDNIPRAIDLIREAQIPRQSIDLIYAIPGQTIDEWADDLSRALALNTTHLSCYNLVYEPNTPMTNRLKRGEFTPMGEDLEADMFELTATMLEPRGLRRYEVSNYAVPGHESRHNLAYWLQEDWLAAGPSASGHRAGHRWKNIGNLTHYLQSAGFSPISDHEPPDPIRSLRERLMTGLRLARGVERASFLTDVERLAPDSVEQLVRTAQHFIDDGLLDAQSPNWIVTSRGWLLADFIAKKLMAAVQS